MLSKVLGTWFHAWGTWYMILRIRVSGFESTGYMVSEILGYGVHNFSLPHLPLQILLVKFCGDPYGDSASVAV